MKKVILLILFLPVFSWASSPVGLWKTIDDKTGREKSIVKITENGKVLNGSIERLLDSSADKVLVCDQCTDDRKGKPLVGLNILRGLKQSADNADIWEGGTVLDPKNGKIYKARVKMADDGKKLELRGYLGPFFRTQVWEKVQ